MARYRLFLDRFFGFAHVLGLHTTAHSDLWTDPSEETSVDIQTQVDSSAHRLGLSAGVVFSAHFSLCLYANIDEQVSMPTLLRE